MTAYKDWLRGDKDESINTCKSKLSHVKKFLDVAYKERVYANFFKGQKESRKEHESYEEADILELI